MVAAALASGISAVQAADSEVTELSYWALSTRQNAIEPIVEAFNEANENVHITVSFFDTDGLKDACKVAASSDTLPSMWFNWGGVLGSFYVDNGLTYDLTAYAEEHDWDEFFDTNALSLCTFDGKVSGYPTSYNLVGMFYKKQIFEDLGLEIPTTFEEFETLCADLKENGIVPVSTAGLNGWHVMRFVEQLIEYYAGPELHDAMNSFTESWDNEAVEKAFTKYKEYVENGYFPDGFVTADPNDTLMNLGLGVCAMDIQPQTYDANFLNNDMDPNDYGVFYLPTTGTSRLSSFAEMTQFNANLTEEELAACISFMDYYYNDENVETYADYMKFPVPRVSATIPDKFPHVSELVAAAAENGTFAITDQVFPTEVADVLFECQDAVALGTMEPSECGPAIQTAIEEYLAK